MPREGSLARNVYGRRDPFPDEVTELVRLFEGRMPKASRLRVRKLNHRCASCGHPLADDCTKKRCDRCIERGRRKPPHPDSIQEVKAFEEGEEFMFRAVGRMA